MRGSRSIQDRRTRADLQARRAEVGPLTRQQSRSGVSWGQRAIAAV